ncbi:hypothetical protein VHEMI08096 [[Torrubiella] hemipterigena]|uniref:Infection structure specific protein n=1 Tax=[Torrubiella] hemipterigena TaxID=1531966 RepID=A0A0A1TMT9_9HYPO|nr:hypothetical protein VHEMI08096 [[Torrubiella] hemipterigena]
MQTTSFAVVALAAFQQASAELVPAEAVRAVGPQVTPVHVYRRDEASCLDKAKSKIDFPPPPSAIANLPTASNADACKETFPASLSSEVMDYAGKLSSWAEKMKTFVKQEPAHCGRSSAVEFSSCTLPSITYVWSGAAATANASSLINSPPFPSKIVISDSQSSAATSSAVSNSLLIGAAAAAIAAFVAV